MVLLRSNSWKTHATCGGRGISIEYRPMPQQTIIPIRNPMALIRKVQKSTRHAQTLQHIERLQGL